MTELTIDQALQQAIEAHKAGRVQEADRLYTAILKAQPKQPNARPTTVTSTSRRITQAVRLPASTRLGLKQKYCPI
jgi:hypothetical protein